MSGDLTKDETDWKVLAREEQLRISKGMLSPLEESYEDIGVSAMLVARTQKQALKATRITLTKIKGALPQALELARGYRVITPTEQVKIFDEAAGVEITVDPGETIIEHRGPDWPTRLKAVDQVVRARGWAGTDKVEQVNSGTVIHVHTSMPGPDPLPEVYRKQLEAPEDE